MPNVTTGRRVAAALAAMPLLAACGAAGLGAEDGDLRVVASFYPLEYVAERVAGSRAEVVGITSPGGEPHDAELTVAQTAELSEAEVLVYLADFQPAVDEAVAQSAAEHVVEAGEHADLRAPEELAADEDAHAEDPHAEDDGHDHGAEDLHFWTDPTRLAEVAAAVERQLSAADPDGAAEYRRNLEALEDDLTTLDRDLRNGLADCARDTVVVSHDAFAYFGARYGLEMHAINGLSPDAEPSPAHLRELADLIEAEGITTVFSETLASPEMAQTLAGDLGLRTDVLDPVEGLTDTTAGEDYVSLMRRNLAALQKANDCS